MNSVKSDVKSGSPLLNLLTADQTSQERYFRKQRQRDEAEEQRHKLEKQRPLDFAQLCLNGCWVLVVGFLGDGGQCWGDMFWC